jgi:hypothetical protein
VQCAGVLNDLPDAFIMEFGYFAGTDIDQVVVLGGCQRFLKLSNILPKLVLDNQFAVKQNLNGIIQRCPAHPIILVLHGDIERLNVKMTIARIDLIQDSISLRGFPMTVSLEVLGKNILDRFFVFLHAIHT